MRTTLRRLLIVTTPVMLLAMPAIAAGSTGPQTDTNGPLVSSLPVPPAHASAPPLASSAVSDTETASAVFLPVPSSASPGTGTRPLPANLGNPAGCVLRIADAHISTYYGRKGVKAVKVNADIRCRYPVQAMALEVNLYKLNFFNLIADLQASTVVYAFNKASVQNQGTYRVCTNSKSTEWFGTAYGLAEEGGRLYEAEVRSPHTRTLNCGT